MSKIILRDRIITFIEKRIPILRRTRTLQRQSLDQASASRLDVETVHALLPQADAGDARQLMALYDTIIYSDAHLQSELASDVGQNSGAPGNVGQKKGWKRRGKPAGRPSGNKPLRADCAESRAGWNSLWIVPGNAGRSMDKELPQGRSSRVRRRVDSESRWQRQVDGGAVKCRIGQASFGSWLRQHNLPVEHMGQFAPSNDFERRTLVKSPEASQHWLQA